MKKLLVLGFTALLAIEQSHAATTAENLLTTLGAPIAGELVNAFCPEVFTFLDYAQNPDQLLEKGVESFLGKESWENKTDEELKSILDTLAPNQKIQELQVRTKINEQSNATKVKNLEIAQKVLKGENVIAGIGDIVKTSLLSSAATERSKKLTDGLADLQKKVSQ